MYLGHVPMESMKCFLRSCYVLSYFFFAINWIFDVDFILSEYKCPCLQMCRKSHWSCEDFFPWSWWESQDQASRFLKNIAVFELTHNMVQVAD